MPAEREGAGSAADTSGQRGERKRTRRDSPGGSAIDEQAEAASQAAGSGEGVKKSAPSKKRGRPSKADLAARAQEVAQKDQEGAASTSADEPPAEGAQALPRKRGRPSKVEIARRLAAAEAATASPAESEQDDTGAPETLLSRNGSPATPAAQGNGKKRGRPSKAELERRKAAVAEGTAERQGVPVPAEGSGTAEAAQMRQKKRGRPSKADVQSRLVEQRDVSLSSEGPSEQTEKHDERPGQSSRPGRKSAAKARQTISTFARTSQLADDDPKRIASTSSDGSEGDVEDELGAGLDADPSDEDDEEEDEEEEGSRTLQKRGRKKAKGQEKKQKQQQQKSKSKASKRPLKGARAVTWIHPMPVDILVKKIKWPEPGLATLVFNKGSSIAQRKAQLSSLAVEAKYLPTPASLVDRDDYPGRQWSTSTVDEAAPYAIAAPAFKVLSDR
ncbi:hypothetical protein FA10DRAFT_92636 [Acaromyces ingoldii]|uniref:Uncharacterized protein n=1 Tax=Acaromyces ingoldii TaxID=215250 RepID=A0A316YWM6_9BASI|nr:hypothetical protein FA10DRAFT_92636 [Acaromyces ingoldii]PWN92453.1 hypothetical protein FA10DRAFT_92636 [Acaromyces ingoldii]